jgi:asparagine synthase (glutamine-hydrolysing)
MGYRKFQAFYFRRLAFEKRYFTLLGFAATLLPTFFGERRRWMQSWRLRNRYLERSGMATVLPLPESEISIGYDPSSALRDRQIADVTLTSLPALLRLEDSNSMGNSVESRLPFMDYRVMECGLALPEALKLRGGHGKWVVRRMISGKIPESIRTCRRKRGFDVQEARWIQGGLGALMRRMLHDRSSLIRSWIKPGTNIDELFSNESFKNRPSAFCEATSLIWLADVANISRFSSSKIGYA